MNQHSSYCDTAPSQFHEERVHLTQFADRTRARLINGTQKQQAASA